MDCAERNREAPHLGDWWGDLTTTTVPYRTEPFVKVWMSARRMEAGIEANSFSAGMATFSWQLVWWLLEYGEACPMEEWKAAYRREDMEPKPGDWDRVDSDREIECCTNLFSLGAVCMRWSGFDDDRRMMESGPIRQPLGVRWFGNASK